MMKIEALAEIPTSVPKKLKKYYFDRNLTLIDLDKVVMVWSENALVRNDNDLTSKNEFDRSMVLHINMIDRTVVTTKYSESLVKVFTEKGPKELEGTVEYEYEYEPPAWTLKPIKVNDKLNETNVAMTHTDPKVKYYVTNDNNNVMGWSF